MKKVFAHKNSCIPPSVPLSHRTHLQVAEAEALHVEGKFAEAIAALGDDIESNAPLLIKRSRCLSLARSLITVLFLLALSLLLPPLPSL